MHIAKTRFWYIAPKQPDTAKKAVNIPTIIIIVLIYCIDPPPSACVTLQAMIIALKFPFILI